MDLTTAAKQFFMLHSEFNRTSRETRSLEPGLYFHKSTKTKISCLSLPINNFARALLMEGLVSPEKKLMRQILAIGLI